MSTRIKTGLGMAAIIVISVVGGGLTVALPTQAAVLVTNSVTGGHEDATNDGETNDDGVEDGTNDGETADDDAVEDGTQDGETNDDGVEDGTNDGETDDD